MTAEALPAGAISHVKINWHAINWRLVHQSVSRLQARIVKATREKRWNKVKALQHLLTHSFSGRAMAVRRVTENQGKRTPGVDHITWGTPERKAQAMQTLKRRGYHPLPLRRVYIPKSNGKVRPLGIPTMKDRAMQALHLLALDPIAETTGDKNSYGFRKERSTADAIAQCFILLSRQTSAQWILEGDIKSCFDGISHDWLSAHVLMDKTILRKWLKAGYMEGYALYPTEAGTPQGGVASPTLANLTLDGLESALMALPKGRQSKVHLVRYADDFIITASSKELLEEEVKPLVEQFMKERGLELSQEKTRVTHIENGFDFLGQNVRKYGGKLLIKPSQKNIKAFLDKVRGIIKTNLQTSAGTLTGKLNPVIRGWANYHQHIVSKQVYSKVDDAIHKAIWRWATRRHPQKSRKWVKRKYFCTYKMDGWTFFGTVTDSAGVFRQVRLFKARSTPIRRHVKVKGEANPYAPEWKTYFDKRHGVKIVRNLKDKRLMLNLWKQQDGLCPNCGQKITELTGWHNHHIIRRENGGGDEPENRVLLHPNCHSQVHSQDRK